ncbi:hypothetical protein WT83_16590 [Burkholderia territorii]|uniref:Uncharacterized protein n=1 Tax=Burkholderia territorii TaxID=1503055 RepID=A0A108ENX2_9BURK|nr:hypothetical protein WT83_16590 [Burkholderia territorii]
MPPKAPKESEVLKIEHVTCDYCGETVAMLMFAPHATNEGHFMDYASKMYPISVDMNVPT